MHQFQNQCNYWTLPIQVLLFDKNKLTEVQQKTRTQLNLRKTRKGKILGFFESAKQIKESLQNNLL